MQFLKKLLYSLYEGVVLLTAITVQNHDSTDCCMKKFEINFQKFSFVTAYTAALPKFYLRSFFPNENCLFKIGYLADHRFLLLINRTIISVLLTKKETESFQMPKQTL